MLALELNNLSKSYGDKEVVKRLSFSIQEGEIFGLLGPNGAGKSTTINMISGVTRVGSGSVAVFGKDNQSDFTFTRRAVGVMHQEIVVDTFFTIDRALKIHSGYYGVKDDPTWRNLLIERLALGPHLKKPMNRLSGGMKRRFMVAKALIHKPRLLILDEPTAGVDVELRQNLWSFVREINKSMGITVLLTTHYLEEAEEMCGRIAIMNHGELIALDRTKELLRKLEEKRLFIHLNSPISAVPESLKNYGSELLENGLLLKVQIGKQQSTNSVLESIAKAQLSVKDLETQSPNLQEAFLKLTKGTHV